MKKTAVEVESLIEREETPDELIQESIQGEESRIEKDEQDVSLENLKNDESRDLDLSNIDKLQKSNYNIFDKFDEDNISEPKKLYLKTEFELEHEKDRQSFRGRMRKLSLKIKALSIKIYSNFIIKFVLMKNCKD